MTAKVTAWLKKYNAWIAWIWAMLTFGWGTYLWATHQADQPPPLPPAPPPFVQPAPDPEPVTYSFGWHEDKEATEAFQKTLPHPEFADTPAGKAILAAGEPAQLWKDVEKVWQLSRFKTANPYPNIDQKSVGCCVGAATKHVEDVLAAVQVMQKTGPGEWRPFSAEAIYAAGRVDIGRGGIRGDGSLGEWSAAAANQIGNLPMEQIGGVDLRVFDPMRARSWGNSGVPAAVKGFMGQYKIGQVTRIRSWEEAKKALDQDYPVLLCSNQGFEGRKDRMGHLVRDTDGALAPGGSWPHAMALLGYAGGARERGYILNSWGDAIIIGPRGEGDPPVAGFYADAAVINRMCSSGSCWAFSNFAGFPARKVNWRTVAPRRGVADLFALSPDRRDRWDVPVLAP